MTTPSIRQLLVVAAIMSLIAVSTAAVAHAHLDANSADESHCAFCMAVHSAKHAVATPAVTLCFTAAQTATLIPPKRLAWVFVQPLLAQDRAPPAL
jgi:hypothetical protein